MKKEILYYNKNERRILGIFVKKRNNFLSYRLISAFFTTQNMSAVFVVGNLNRGKNRMPECKKFCSIHTFESVCGFVSGSSRESLSCNLFSQQVKGSRPKIQQHFVEPVKSEIFAPFFHRIISKFHNFLITNIIAEIISGGL